MKKPYSYLKSWFTLLIISFLLSCEQGITSLEDLSKLQIKVEDNNLAIKNEDEFNSLMEKFNPYTTDGFDKDGFTSLLTIYNQAIAEDEKYFEYYESFTEDELQAKFPNGISPHSEYVNKHARLFKFSEKGWFELNISDFRVAGLINPEGIVKVGNVYRKYVADGVLFSESLSALGFADKASNQSLPDGVTAHQYERLIIEQPEAEARVISSSFRVNECTDREDRYRVRLYEEILVANKGGGIFELTYGFSVRSYRHTVWGWERRFETEALAGSVDYQASFGSDSKLITANGRQDIIGWTFVSGYNFTEFNPPEIFYSYGQGWGRNGCYCNYTGYY